MSDLYNMKLHRLNYLYLFLLLNWKYVGHYFVIDGRGRITMILTGLILLINVVLNSNFQKVFFKKPIIYWGIWIIYSFINSFFKGLHHIPWDVYVFYLIYPFVGMVITYWEYKRNPERILKYLSFFLSFFCLIGLLGLEKMKEERMFSEMLGNELPLTCVILIAIFCFRFIRNELSYKKLMIIIVFSFYIIIMAATRKALGASVLIVLLTIFVKNEISSLKQILKLLPILFIFYIGINYVLNETIIGERLLDTEEQGSYYNTTNYEYLNFLGDRVGQYVMGWKIFQDNFFTGIGLYNFSYYTKSYHQLHTEYIVQIAECGFVGFVFFILFYFTIGFRLLKQQKSSFIKILIGIFGAILFINITAWTYSFVAYFMMFGIIIAQLERNNTRIKE